MVLLQHLSKMESLPQFSGWTTLGVHAGEILVDHEPESDDGGDMEDGTWVDAAVEDAAMEDAAVEDAIADQLFELDNLQPDPIPYEF
jgi:hypothetical protein